MKKILGIGFILCCATGVAQNVGVGEANPTAMKLQVKTADSAVMLLQNSTAAGSNIKTGMYYKTGSNFSGAITTIGSGATFRMGMFTYGGPTPSSLIERVSILDNGNVGVGTTNPTAKLEVAGTFKLADGTEGAKKILTSDAAGNASWAKAAYGNVERFQYTIKANFANPIVISTDYSYGTTTTSYTAGADRFYINFTTPGLYHFDIHFNHVVTGNATITSPNPLTSEVNFATSTRSFSSYVPFYAVLGGTLSTASFDKSLDVFVPSSGYFYVGSTKLANNFNYVLTVTGHLISE